MSTLNVEPWVLFSRNERSASATARWKSPAERAAVAASESK